MKKAYCFGGLLLGFAFALVIWPENEREVVADFPIPKEAARVHQRPVSELLAECRAASTKKEIYQTQEALGRIASRKIPAVLALVIHDGPERDLSREARCLFVHWAGSDPEMALDWAWEHLRTSRKWDVAVDQIFETWIASGDFAVLDFLKKAEKSEESLSEEDAEKDLAMFFSNEQMSSIEGWLYFYDGGMARAAFEQRVGYQAHYPRRIMFADRLESPEAVKRELEIWGSEDAEMVYGAIRERGEALGMDFSEEDEKAQVAAQTRQVQPSAVVRLYSYWRSARTDLPKTFKEVAKLDAQDRHAAYLAIYDSLTMVNPGGVPNVDSLPAEVRELWRDLSELGAVDDDYGISNLVKE